MKIEIKKVDKERGIVQITTPDERWYPGKSIAEIDELKSLSQEDFYPSTTWICSYYPKNYRFMRWLAEKGWDEAELIKQTAAEKGSRVHRACDDLIKGIEIFLDSKYPNNDGELAELTAEEYGIIMTFKDFLEKEQPVIINTDYTLLNHEYKYGGTLDIKCRIKSDDYKFVHIIDIKTSSDIWPSHEIQVSSYMAADPECKKIDILQVGYRRNKNGWKLTGIDYQFDLFLAARQIWKKETEGVLVPQREYPFSLKWVRQIEETPIKKTKAVKKVKKTIKKVKKIK